MRAYLRVYTYLIPAALQEDDRVLGSRLVGPERLREPLPVLGEEGEGNAQRVLPHREESVARVRDIPGASRHRRL